MEPGLTVKRPSLPNNININNNISIKALVLFWWAPVNKSVMFICCLDRFSVIQSNLHLWSTKSISVIKLFLLQEVLPGTSNLLSSELRISDDWKRQQHPSRPKMATSVHFWYVSGPICLIFFVPAVDMQFTQRHLPPGQGKKVEVGFNYHVMSEEFILFSKNTGYFQSPLPFS